MGCSAEAELVDALAAVTPTEADKTDRQTVEDTLITVPECGLTAPRHYTGTSPPGAKYLQCTTKKARHTAPAAARSSSCYSSSGRSSSSSWVVYSAIMQ